VVSAKSLIIANQTQPALLRAVLQKRRWQQMNGGI